MAVVREYVKEDTEAKGSCVYVVAGLVDQLEEAGEGGGAFGFFEQAVVDRHGLGCLAGACGCHGGEVNEVFPEGLFELGHEGVCVVVFGFSVQSFEQVFGFFQEVDGCGGGGDFNGGFVASSAFSGFAPVAEACVDESFFISDSGEVKEVAEDKRGGFFGCLQVSAEFQQVKWDFCDDLIPGGAAAEAPACGGDDSGEAAVGGLGEFHVMKPFPEGVFCGEVHQHVFGRQGGVSCPSVFFAVGTVCGEPEKVGDCGVSCHCLQFVGYGVGAGKASDFLKVSAHDMVCQEIGEGLVLFNSFYIGVSEAVVGKGGDVGLFLVSAAYVGAVLYPVGVWEVIFGEHKVLFFQNAVMVPFGIGYLYFLARFSLYSEFAYSCGVCAEIIEVTVFIGYDGNGFSAFVGFNG